MFRKTLTILSLLGLLLSVAAWGVSYWGPGHYSDTPQARRDLRLCYGGLYYLYEPYPTSPDEPGAWFSGWPTPQGWSCNGFNGWTRWLPTVTPRMPYRGWHYVHLPLWMPTAVFGLWFAFCRPLTSYRRRKRKKLGLCAKCGYDLRGSKKRCPECGTRFETPKLDADC